MRDTNADLLHQAKQAIKAKQKLPARRLLQQAILADPRDHRAWAWMAALAPSANAGMDYIRQAEKLAPDDPFVQKVKGWLDKQIRPAATAAPAVPPEPSAEPESVAAPVRRSWQTAVIWGSIVTLIVILVGMGSVALWGWLSQPDMAAAETAVLRQPIETDPSTNLPAARPPAAATPPSSRPEPTNEAIGVPAKNIAANHNQKNSPRPTWTPTPIPTNTPLPTPTPVPTFISPNNSKPTSRPFGVGANERWVDVDLTRQTFTAYEGDIPVMTTLISSGLPQYPTVTGQFRVWLRYESQTMDGRRLGYDYYLEDVPYVMYFYQDYALHGTYWHNNFGTPMSHGCVNMRIEDAEWLFNWSQLGTVVNVHY